MLSAVSRIAIIGGGNIGEALLSGLLRSGRQAADIVVSERVPARARYLAERYDVPVSGLPDAVGNADFVVIAVKPSDVEPVVAEIAERATPPARQGQGQVFVTVAAGVTTAYYEAKLPAGSPVIRVMPNAPILVGAGVSAIAKGRFATSEQLNQVAALFESVGGVRTVPEAQLDAVTALSGSGPAYFFLMAEALIDAGVQVGLTRAVATDLVVQTLAGSAAMLLEQIEQTTGPSTHTIPAQLRATITSPGGTTAAGLRELERGQLREAVAAAVEAATKRSRQLGITSE